MLKTLRSRRSHSLSPTNSAGSLEQTSTKMHVPSPPWHARRAGPVHVQSPALSSSRLLVAALHQRRRPLFQLHETSHDRAPDPTNPTNQSTSRRLQPLALSSVPGTAYRNRPGAGWLQNQRIGQPMGAARLPCTGHRPQRQLATRHVFARERPRRWAERRFAPWFAPLSSALDIIWAFSVPRGVFPVL